MKKRITAALLTCVLLLTLCACGGAESSGGKLPKPLPSASGNAKTPQEEADKEDSGKRSGKVSVTELISEEDTVTGDDGLQYDYAYHIPQIEDDTPDAKAINQEIAESYGEGAERELASIMAGELPGYSVMTYDQYQSGGILSLVMKATWFYTNEEEYCAYLYDTATGERLDDLDILDRNGIDTEDYLSAVRRAAARKYDDNYFSVWTEENGRDLFSGEYQELRSWTLTCRNIRLGQPLYPDSDGALHTIVPIGSDVGASWYEEDLTLTFGAGEPVKAESQLDYLTASYRDGEVTLCFTETPDIPEELEWMDEVPYNRDIPVSGLYGDYVRILCCMAGSPYCAERPYVFLLTREGRVDYIDVITCLGNEYFCGSGPLLWAKDVVDLAPETDEEGIWMAYAVTESGEKIELSDLVTADQYTIPPSFSSYGWSTDWDGMSLNLELYPGNGENIRLTALDDSLNLFGNLCYLGMTGDGLVYSYSLWGEDVGDGGIIALRVVDDYSDEKPSALYITGLSGDPFPFGELWTQSDTQPAHAYD